MKLDMLLACSKHPYFKHNHLTNVSSASSEQGTANYAEV